MSKASLRVLLAATVILLLGLSQNLTAQFRGARDPGVRGGAPGAGGALTGLRPTRGRCSASDWRTSPRRRASRTVSVPDSTSWAARVATRNRPPVDRVRDRTRCSGSPATWNSRVIPCRPSSRRTARSARLASSSIPTAPATAASTTTTTVWATATSRIWWTV